MIYLLSYCPLANSQHGREVAARNGLPPYVDASCRREPDFELPSPFVSGLCRPNFIATLNVGDLLVYVTKMSAVHRDGRRLVAVVSWSERSDHTQMRRSGIRAMASVCRTVVSCREMILSRSP